MNFELNEDQFVSLLKALYLTSWMLPGNPPDNNEDNAKILNVINLLMKRAKEEGMDRLVDEVPESGEYFHSRVFDNDPGLLEIIEEFHETNFWEELLHRLVDRDMEESYGEAAIQKMEVEERIEKERVYFEKYADEFESNGIAKLQIASS